MAVKHRQAAGDVEAAHGDLHARRPEGPGDVERARILVRLHADQSDKPEIAVLAQGREQRRHVDAGIGLVEDRDVDGDVWPERFPLGAIDGDPVDRRQRVGGDHRAPPADHITVVVVM